MQVNKEYLEALREKIRLVPWRCDDEDLEYLLGVTETLLWEYEELNKKYIDLLTESIKHADLLHHQVVHHSILTLQQQVKLD